MKNKIKNLFWIAICCMSIINIHGQGCSDAGFCTMGAMRPGQSYSSNVKIVLKSIEFSQYVANTHFKDQIYATTLDFNIGISNKDAAQFKIPYMSTTGPLGQANGLGDISWSYTRTLIKTTDYQFNVTGGGKIPLGNSDEAVNGNDLPMYYQPSLGTYDLVFGLSFLTDKWLLATRLQYSLNSNKNDFTWQPWWDDGADWNDVMQYPESVDLDRGKDVMLRVERSLRKSNWGFSFGLLGIYRLNKDISTNRSTGEREFVDGSKGLALTALLGLKYNFNVKSGVKLIYGQRLIDREFNPDGLSREQVVEIGYVYQF